MTFELNLPLARSAVDRDYLTRESEELLAEILSHADTRVLVLHNGLTILHGTADAPEPAIRLLALGDVPEALHTVYLGKTEVEQGEDPAGTRVVLRVIGADSAARLSATSGGWHHLRRTGAGLTDRDAGLFSQALAIANWHEHNTFCPACGSETKVERAGWSRRCLSDDRELFPRTDPAIIVGVTDHADRILLGSQGIWEENRYSILAGFVEPGESLEAAVRREMVEEAGVVVGQPIYLGSQAWPFPYSLMMGFTAKLAEGFAAGFAEPDGQEIEKLRWFTREELVAEAPNLLLPARVSIARAIIERWLGFQVESATELDARP